MTFPSLQEIENLTRDDQIEAIKNLRTTNRIHEMATGFGFKSPSMYYNWLKKLKIYEDLCGKKNVFIPLSSDPIEPIYTRFSVPETTKINQQIILSNNEIEFNYKLTAKGPQVASLLQKIATFIEDEQVEFSVELHIGK